MSRPTARTLSEEVPGLDMKRVWWYRKYRHIFPNGSLPKKDRDALKAAGYYWVGLWWARNFDEEDFN